MLGAEKWMKTISMSPQDSCFLIDVMLSVKVVYYSNRQCIFVATSSSSLGLESKVVCVKSGRQYGSNSGQGDGFGAE